MKSLLVGDRAMQMLVAAGGTAVDDFAASVAGAERGGFGRRRRRRFLCFGGISALSATLSGLDETRTSSRGLSMHIVNLRVADLLRARLESWPTLERPASKPSAASPQDGTCPLRPHLRDARKPFFADFLPPRSHVSLPGFWHASLIASGASNDGT